MRDCEVTLAHPWPSETVKRNMLPLKFYHDFTWDLGTLHYTNGACWDNTMHQVQQAFDRINHPSGTLVNIK